MGDEIPSPVSEPAVPAVAPNWRSWRDAADRLPTDSGGVDSGDGGREVTDDDIYKLATHAGYWEESDAQLLEFGRAVAASARAEALEAAAEVCDELLREAGMGALTCAAAIRSRK
jgi:hypothetical protein